MVHSDYIERIVTFDNARNRDLECGDLIIDRQGIAGIAGIAANICNDAEFSGRVLDIRIR